MKEYYQIIADETELNKFIEWLPEQNENEKFYLSLQARKKYAPEILKTSHDPQLRRFVARKKELFSKISQLECPVGSYVTKEGVVIPNHALALYITLIPRDMKNATFTATHDLLRLIKENQRFNPYAEVLSSIHRSKTKSKLTHFDVDMEERDYSSKQEFLEVIKKMTIEQIGENCDFDIIETRGGCHVVIDSTKVERNNNWYQGMKQFSDQDGDIMMPVVGCYQGGFITKFVDR